MVANKDESPEEIMARALMIAKSTLEKQKQAITAAKRQVDELEQDNRSLLPGATFAKAVESSGRSVLIGELARIIGQNGVEIGQKRLFAWLRDNKYLCMKGEMYNLPTQKAMDLGLFEIKKTVIAKPNGDSLVTNTTKVTGKGQVYFVNKFLQKGGAV